MRKKVSATGVPVGRGTLIRSTTSRRSSWEMAARRPRIASGTGFELGVEATSLMTATPVSSKQLREKRQQFGVEGRRVALGKHGTLIASVACPHRGEGSSQTEASQRRTCATVGLVPVPVSLISSSLSIYDVGVVSCADASVSGPGASPLYIYDKGLGVSAAAGATSGHL